MPFGIHLLVHDGSLHGGGLLSGHGLSDRSRLRIGNLRRRRRLHRQYAQRWNLPRQLHDVDPDPERAGNDVVDRPSLDTGLFTSSKLSTTVTNATADVGIEVCVYVDPTFVKGAPTGGLTVNPTNCVVYDQRIQQVSNTLFGQLSSCLAPACTSDAQCAALGAGTCNIPVGSTSGTCSGPNTTTCNFEILLTTLSAHSFDFAVPMPGNGSHNVVMTWAMIGTSNNTAGGGTDACVGPVTLTVQQVKNFHNDQTIQFSNN
jgi:hypothetical protein